MSNLKNQCLKESSLDNNEIIPCQDLIAQIQILRFQCKTCGTSISIGHCANHRLKTNHTEFEAIYGVVGK